MTSPAAKELARWIRTRATVIQLRDAALAGAFVLNPGETPAAELIGNPETCPYARARSCSCRTTPASCAS